MCGMLQGDRQHRWLACLAILAVLARIVTAVLCHPALATPPAAFGDDGFAAMVICTSHGAQTLGDPSGDDRTGPSSPPSHCEACALATALVLSLALLFTRLAFDLSAANIRTRSIAGLLADHVWLGGIGSRAPPLQT